MFLLRENELNAGELASKLGLTTQNIYHHIKKLQDAGLVEVSDERPSGHLIESYYTATADTFVYHADSMVEKSIQSSFDILNGVKGIGVNVDVSMENAGRLSEFHQRLSGSPTSFPIKNEICSSSSFSGCFMKYGPMNPMLLCRILKYHNLMLLTDEEFEESLQLTRQLREFLLSIRN